MIKLLNLFPVSQNYLSSTLLGVSGGEAGERAGDTVTPKRLEVITFQILV